MPENGEKTTIHVGVISKKATLHVQHTFLYISLPLFCATTTWNFQKLLSYTFYGGNVIGVLVHFFFTTTHFHLAWVATSISHFLTAACSSNKKCLLCCLSLALDLCHPFSHWVSMACRLLSLFLCLSVALYSKFVDMTISLCLML